MGNKWNQFFLLLILSVILIACPLKTEKITKSTDATSNAAQTTEKTLTGLVETGPNGVVITVDWTRKCRASYTVTGSFKKKLTQLKGKIVTVTGAVTRISPWSGTICVTSAKVEK